MCKGPHQDVLGVSEIKRRLMGLEPAKFRTERRQEEAACRA